MKHTTSINEVSVNSSQIVQRLRSCFHLRGVAGATLLLCVWANPVLGQSTKVEPIPDDIWTKMQGRSWHPTLGCPSRDDLVFLTVPYHDFSGQSQMGHLIVAKDSSKEISEIFNEIFKSDFRIEKMNLIDDYEGVDNKSMDDNNTSAFNCRLKTGGKTLSAHSYGSAVDINPVQNPYVRKGEFLPKAGKLFADPKNRTRDRLGVIVKGGAVIAAFSRQKWQWGGNWKSLKDYQHFSRNGE